MSRDICANYHRGQDTSLRAFADIQGVSGKLRLIIWQTVFEAGTRGMTCEELEDALGMKHQTCSARITELKKSGHLVVSGRRKNRGGSSARAYIIAEGRSL